MGKDTVLVIDDEKNIREALRIGLKMEGFEVITAEDGVDGLEKFETIGADVVLIDLKMPRMGGMEFLEKATAIDNNVPFVILTGHGGIDEAVEAMKRGAYDFLTKPLDFEHLSFILKRAIDEQRRKTKLINLASMLDEKYSFENIIGNSPAIHKVLDMVKQVAPTTATVLITGDSGTGKELIAGAIHLNSKRKNKSFIKVHCAALPENLLESELFGHEKGSFTGAIARKKGRFELADGGTIFLDEIGEISQSVQVKLLRVLQEREFERVGGEETIKVDIRIIAATNRDLKAEVDKGNFREDLYYRLNVVNIEMPRLAQRTGDVVLLANYFLGVFASRHDKVISSFSPKALKLLERYNWQGNIRELQNVIENAVVLSNTKILDENSLPTHIREYSGKNNLTFKLGLTMAEIEKQTILATVDYVDGNKSHAARILGIGRKTLLRKLDEYGVKKTGESQ